MVRACLSIACVLHCRCRVRESGRSFATLISTTLGVEPPKFEPLRSPPTRRRTVVVAVTRRALDTVIVNEQMIKAHLLDSYIDALSNALECV